MGLFEAYNEFLAKWYGRTCSKETFAKFVRYCDRNETENGVKPILNPINLYAFGKGTTSAEANELLLKNY